MNVLICAVSVAFSALESGAATDSVKVRLLIQQLRGGGIRERVEAARELGSVRDKNLLQSFKVPDVLAKTARDDGQNPRVRKEAVDALVTLTTDVDPNLKLKTQDVLLKMLRNSADHDTIRLRAADGLGRILKKDAIQDRSGIEDLMKTAENTREEPALRALALLSIGQIGADKLAERVRKLISDRNPEVRDAAMEVLGLIAGQEAGSGMLRILWEIVENPNSKKPERLKALQTIISIIGTGVKSKTAGPKIVRLLRAEKDEEVLLLAVDLASKCGEPGAVQHIEAFYRKLSGQEKSRMRVAICTSLGDMVDKLGARVDFSAVSRGAKRIIALLIDALKNDDSPAVARAAAFSLGQACRKKFDRREIVRELIDALAEDPDEAVRKEAAESLSMITGRSYGTDVEKWRRYYKENVSKLGPRGR